MPESSVRRARIDGVVDTGAVMLMLPQNVVERLGLRTRQTVIVTYADERKEERQVAGPVTVQIGDRITQTQCVYWPAPVGGVDRSARAGGDGHGGRLHKPHLDAEDSGLSASEDEVSPHGRYGAGEGLQAECQCDAGYHFGHVEAAVAVGLGGYGGA